MRWSRLLRGNADYVNDNLVKEMVNYRKKLLVLDINGLLLDTYYQGEARPHRPHDAKVNRFYVYKRTFCDGFIQFCLKNFIVGVWSSAREHNVHSLVDFVFKEAKGDLAFIWHQQHCTDTGFRHPDNKHKPVFLKKMSRLWESYEPELPWAKGDFSPSNTLLIDDSPYKAIGNPRHTAIFPKTYKATEPENNYLAEELLPYLEDLLKARDVQKYIQRNPVGEASISPSDPQWSQILKSGQFNNDEELHVPAHWMGIRVPVRPDPILSSEWTRQRNLPKPNGVTVPPHTSAQSQSWNALHGDRRWRRLDRVTQPDWAYNGVAYDPQGFARGYFESGAGPSWPPRQMPTDTSYDLFKRHAVHSGRPSDRGDISRGEDWKFNDFHSHNRYDRRDSSREYDNRASGWSEGPEDFNRGELWDFHRGGARYQDGSYQGEGKKKRRVDWTRDPKGGRMDENCVIRPRGRSAEADFEEPYYCQRRASPRHDQRREESQFRIKLREGRDLQRYADKELPRERDLSEDSGRHSQKHEHSNDGSQPRSRRKSGRKDQK